MYQIKKGPFEIVSCHCEVLLIIKFIKILVNYEFIHLQFELKFMFSIKATKFDKIFTIDLTLCSKRQIDVVKILSIFVAFLENMNFICYIDPLLCYTPALVNWPFTLQIGTARRQIVVRFIRKIKRNSLLHRSNMVAT